MNGTLHAMLARWLNSWFKVESSGSSLIREVIAGITTFAAMSYILAVNPMILAEAGIDKGAAITATALASAIMTAVFALRTNYPIALAPGMGMNAFFAYTICIQQGIPWQAALGLVFVSGVLFLLLSVSGVRRRIMEAIPIDLKIAISAGIGLFIAFIGLQKGGLIKDHPVTLVTAGQLGSASSLLVLAGIILAATLAWRRVPGAILLSIIAVTVAGFVLPGEEGRPITQWPSGMESFSPVALPASLEPTFLKLDIGYVLRNIVQVFPLLMALLFVDVFDNIGTLIGVTRRAGLLDENGNLPRLGQALTADATAAMVGSVLGTSTVTSYIESAAGVEEGGRTGLTAMVVSLCFLGALFLHPLIQMVPSAATAPALVLLGVFMMQGIGDINWKELTTAVPAGLTILLMPLTFSISEGLALGFVVWVILALATGSARKVSLTAWILGLLFIAHIVTR